MLSYCLKCRKNLKVVKTKNGRIMLLSNCVICSSEKSRFIKKQAKGLLGSMIDKIQILGPILI